MLRRAVVLSGALVIVARRRFGRMLVAAAPLAVLVADVASRHASYPHLLGTGAPFVASWVASGLLWSLLVIAGARRRGAMRWAARGGLAVLGALVGFQVCALEHFDTYIDYGVLRSAWLLHGMGSFVPIFAGVIATWSLIPAAAAFAYPMVLTRVAPSLRAGAMRAFGGALVLGAASTFMGAYATPAPLSAAPDVLALGAVGRFAIERPQRQDIHSNPWRKVSAEARRVAPLSAVEREPGPARDVLLILTESVRAEAVCSAHATDCPHNPDSNAAAPDRLPLERMRSVDSFTALSFGVLFTGLPVNATKEQWLTAPLLFHYAHAGGVATAYWSAQHPAFADAHVWTDGAPLDRCAWATDFEQDPDSVTGAADSLVVDRAIAELPTLREPFFAVVHFSNTHFPYRIDPSDAPFQPESNKLDRRDPAPLRNRYYDSILHQDRSTGKLLRALRAMEIGRRTVVVYLSDHGESFFEHDTALHGSSLWDPELRVPAWVDAPRGTLTAGEEASLRGERDAPVTHVDVAPTLLDLLHLHDFASHMPGKSLLRSPAPDRLTVVSTCNEAWSCFVPSWGKLLGDRKYVTRPPNGFQCFDTRADPSELHDLGPEACRDLAP